MKFLFFLILNLLCKLTLAQSPIGVYEGLMGNAGVAISDSMAPSYYNPSLLRDKNKGSYSLSANTFDQSDSHEKKSNATSTTITPGYLSSILTGESLNHEFFLANLTPSQVSIKSSSLSNGVRSSADSQMNLTQVMTGYTLAVKSFPLAFSFFGIYSQNDELTLSESKSASTNLIQSYSTSKYFLKDFSLGVSASSHLRFKRYSIGYQYRSRTFKIYEKKSGYIDTYTPDSSTNSLTKTSSSVSPSSNSTSGETLIIGHGFKLDSVEFLTDTFLEEENNLIHKYSAYQSFGFRVFSENEHQFLVGLKQQLGDQIKYLGQSTYISCGYSWKTRDARSAFGIYTYQNHVEQNISKYGITYSSEISY